MLGLLVLMTAATEPVLRDVTRDAIHLYSHQATTAAYPTSQIMCNSDRPELCPKSMVCQRKVAINETTARWWCATVRRVHTLCNVRGRIECEWHDAAHTLVRNNTCRWIGSTPCRLPRPAATVWPVHVLRDAVGAAALWLWTSRRK